MNHEETLELLKTMLVDEGFEFKRYRGDGKTIVAIFDKLSISAWKVSANA